MEIDVLRSLVAVADTGSFSRAATVLCVSQSAVSKRVKLLEDRVCLPLLDRSGPTLQLTPAGTIVVNNARMIIDICCRCTEELNNLKHCRKLAFCCTPAFGFSYLPQVVQAFMEQCPDISDFRFSYDDPEKLIEGLLNSAFQLAVLEHCGSFQLQGTLLGRLPDDSMVLVGSPALNIPIPQTTLGDLLPHNLYLRSTGCCSRRILDQLLAERGRSLNEFNRLLAYDDLNMILQAVRDGHGIAYIPYSVAELNLSDGSLIAFNLDGFDQPLHRSLVAGPGFVASPEAEMLLKIINDVACGPSGR